MQRIPTTCGMSGLQRRAFALLVLFSPFLSAKESQDISSLDPSISVGTLCKQMAPPISSHFWRWFAASLIHFPVFSLKVQTKNGFGEASRGNKRKGLIGTRRYWRIITKIVTKRPNEDLYHDCETLQSPGVNKSVHESEEHLRRSTNSIDTYKIIGIMHQNVRSEGGLELKT